jgi:hypothetical protein
MKLIKIIVKTMCRFCHLEGCSKCDYTGYEKTERL